MSIHVKTFCRAAVSLVLVCAILLAAGCAGGKGTVPAAAVRTISGEITQRKSKVADRSLHLIDADTLGAPMASSGLLQLYLDDNSFGIALYEKTKEKYWYSLPATPGANYDYSAATVELDVLYGNTLYKLNSQDDSMLYRNVACDTLGDSSLFGFFVTYVMTPDAATAQKVSSEEIFNGTISPGNFSKTDIAFQVRVTYELLDGNLYVSADWKNLSENPDAVVCDLTLLPFFGASAQGEKGDYMLVPDGCGAAIHTDVEDDAFEPLALRVYGENPSVAANTDTLPALFPAFGAKQGNNAFAVIIEEGDAIATIHADRTGGEHGLNTVGASFCITEKKETEKSGKPVTFVSKNAYDGEIKLCVRLLGGANAGLDGLAAACREQFMRTGYLSTDTVSNEEYLPFQLNIIGTKTEKAKLIPLFSTVKSLTSFEQAKDLLERMKAKGINNVDVRFKNALKGGSDPTVSGRLRILRKLGGKKGFSALADYTTAQGHSLFLDTPLFSFSSRSKTNSPKALSIESANVLRTVQDPLNGDFTQKLLRTSAIESSVIGILTDAKKLRFDGLCISDASKALYSDYADSFSGRNRTMQILQDNLPSLSTNRLLMVDTGNFYAIKHADIISCLPQTPARTERQGLYTAVPFVQMILHGTLDYTGTPINLAEDTVSAQLRSVEFGCTPCYEWCYSQDGGDIYCFENQLNDAVDFYLKANAALSDLRDARITDNGSTSTAGVHFTQFDNGAILYVNYNDTEAAVGNIHIPANSFQRIG
ncbi:MAG: DUF5696 domain-containing protein [Acutalibacteraceae bacterium]